MDKLKEILDSMDEVELWAIQTDLALIFGNYKMNMKDPNFRFWYALYDEIRRRVDRLLAQEADA